MRLARSAAFSAAFSISAALSIVGGPAQVAWATLPASSPDAQNDAQNDARRATSEWYGWQTLLVDAVVIPASLVTVSADRKLGLLAYSVWALATPVVHAIHGNVGRGGLSIAMRLAGVPLGGVIGMAALRAGAGCRENGCGFQSVIGFVGGASVAGLVIVSIDAFALAHEKIDASPVAVVPIVSVSEENVFAGIGGTF